MSEARGEPERAGLRERVVEALRTVHDPEIPVNVYDLGLIYDVEIDEQAAKVTIRMTLTAPHCPAAEMLPAKVREAVAAVAGVKDVDVEIVWDPPWTPERMSDAARAALGMM